MTDTVLDNGMTISQFATSLMRAFVGCAFRDQQETHDLVLDGPSGAGWLAAALRLAGYYAQSTDQVVEVPFSQLTREVRQTFCDIAGWAFEENPPARTALAWEAVTRHGAGVLSADEDQVGRILDAEAAWRDWLLKTAINRGITLE